MMLTEAKHAHFNDLKFMSEIDFKYSFYDITSDTVLCFHDYKNLKKTFSEFIHITNVENSVFLLIDYHSDFVIKIYQDFQKTFSEFIHTIYINSFIISFYHHDSDSVTESLSFLM